MEYKLISEKQNKSVIEQVLLNRGISNAYKYLNPTIEDTYDPLLLDNMRVGVEMLIKHIKNNNKIFIQIDEDCDGYTSAAVLINYLNTLFPYFTQNNIIYKTHNRKAHGINLEDVPKDVKLVIIPDAGTNQFEEHEKLAAAGIEILILDHHNPEGVSANACIINNQCCDYPNKSLSGVGVVYKFCSYIDSLLGISNAPYFLDLVAVGMIADMMPLNNYETRYFIYSGLSNINNPFLKGMLIKNEFYLKGKLNPHGVSFCIAPAVNAVARVGTMEERKILIDSMIEFTAYDLVFSTKRGASGTQETKVEQSCRNCTNIRNRQNRDRDNSLTIADKKIIEDNLLNNPVLIIQFKEIVNENLTGLVANQLASKYNRPTLVLNQIYEDGKIYWQGSARNAKGTKFENFQQFLLESELVTFAAGHDNAFGSRIPNENMETFKNYCKTNLNEKDFVPLYYVDFIYDAEKINGLDILSLGDLSDLWGEGIEEPQILVKNIKVNSSNLELLKNNTIKISTNRDDNLSYILFKAEEGLYESLYSTYGLTTINIIGTCARNSYNGQPQIIIKDFEIVKKQEYYF